jgi:hypothetical protein
MTTMSILVLAEIGHLIGAKPCGASTFFSDDTGEVDVWRGGKLGKNCRSSTHLAWTPDSEEEMLTVQVSMRQSPGKGTYLYN